MKNETVYRLHVRYDKYTPLNASREKIYQRCAKIEFWKGGIKATFPIRESSWTDKTKYFRFHKRHWHVHPDEGCYSIGDKIGQFYEYVKGDREREESPNSKSPSKVANVEISGEDKKTSKGEHQYMAFITRVLPRDNLMSKWMMKRNITNMVYIHNKDGDMSIKTPTCQC